MKYKLFLLTAAFFASHVAAFAQPAPPPPHLLPPSITVQGRAEMRIPDTEAFVQLGCESAADKEPAVRNDLTTRSQAITHVLKKENVSRLQTSSLNIQPQFNTPQPLPNQTPQTPKIIGYSGQLILSFVVPASDAGRIISAAMEAGANSLLNVQTQPSDEARRDAENKSLALAAKDAEIQARTLISTLGLTWVGIRDINAGNSSPSPFPARAMMMSAAPAPELSVQAGETTVSREVTLQAEFRNP